MSDQEKICMETMLCCILFACAHSNSDSHTVSVSIQPPNSQTGPNPRSCPPSTSQPTLTDTAAEEMLARAQAEQEAAAAAARAALAAHASTLPAWATPMLTHPIGLALLRPYAWAHAHPRPAAGAALTLTAVAAACMLVFGAVARGAEVLLLLALPPAALLWGIAIAGSASVMLGHKLQEARCSTAAHVARSAAVAGGTAAVAAVAQNGLAPAGDADVPAKAKAKAIAAAGKSSARQAADALLSPPTSPRAGEALPETPITIPKGRRVNVKAAAKAAVAGAHLVADGEADGGGTPTKGGRGKGRGAKAAKGAVGKEGGEAAEREEDGEEREKGHEEEGKRKGRKGTLEVAGEGEEGGKAAAADKADGTAAAPTADTAAVVAAGEEKEEASKTEPVKVAAIKHKEAVGLATKQESASGTASKRAAVQHSSGQQGPAGPWLAVGVSGLATAVVVLTFLASVADSLWALPGGQQGAAR